MSLEVGCIISFAKVPAGNAFIGGYVAGYHFSGGDAYDSALYGTVSAGYVVEQMGLPELATAVINGTIRETWNGDLPQTRLELCRSSQAG